MIERRTTMYRVLRSVLATACVVATSCAVNDRAPQPERVAVAKPPAPIDTVEAAKQTVPEAEVAPPVVPAVAPAVADVPPSPAATSSPIASGPAQAVKAAPVSRVAATKAAAPVPAAPGAPAAPAAQVATVKPQPKPAAVVPVAPAPASPVPTPKTVTTSGPAATLDLNLLEARLRDTKAIGVFTKLSLKNQVDDLLDRFRAYHKRQGTSTLAELRRNYDMLMLKVLALLQDSDSALAREIAKSRAAIWSILADPKKFTESKLMAGAME